MAEREREEQLRQEAEYEEQPQVETEENQYNDDYEQEEDYPPQPETYVSILCEYKCIPKQKPLQVKLRLTRGSI